MSDNLTLTYTVMHEAWWNRSHELGWEFQIVQHDFKSSGFGEPRTATRVLMFSDAFDAWRDVPELFTALREQTPKTLDAVRAVLDSLGAVDTTERNIPDSVKASMQTRRDAVRAVVHDDQLAGRVLDALDEFDTHNRIDA